MEKKTLKAGFAGSGFAARFHFEALRRVSDVDVEIAGVYSPTPGHADTFAAERGMKVFSSLDELIAASDVIHVCTPPSSHEGIVIAALEAGKCVIVEKPFTGYFGDGTPEFDGDTFDRRKGLEAASESIARMLEAESRSTGRIMYAENWVYAPAVQKEREIIERSACQILWLTGEQSHSGSHSPSYGVWRQSGGGSLIGKGSHPLGAVLYLKQVEGIARTGFPIRPRSVSARVHTLTRMPSFRNLGHIRASYTDIEDFAAVHILFEDGTVADVFANEISLGGTNNKLEVRADNHRSVCNMSHNDAMETYTPDGKYFDDVYVVEKTETKQGWSRIAPDEGWFLGYQHEMNDFYKAAATGTAPCAGSRLAADTISVIYSAYVSASEGGREVML